MQYTLASVLAFASAALAITVTSPVKGAEWDLSKDNKITWDSVSTDPSTINIVLVNMAVNPSVSLTIANNIPVSQGSYDLKNLVNAPAPGDSYQINLENSVQQGILAQSQQFTVEKSSNSNSQSSASSTESTSTGSTLSTATTKSSPASASASASTSAATSGTCLNDRERIRIHPRCVKIGLI
jgi:hypothetical protein